MKLGQGLQKLGFLVEEGEANFVWITHPQISMKQLQTTLKDHLILVRRFELPGLENFIRMTVPPISSLSRLLDVIKQITLNLFEH